MAPEKREGPRSAAGHQRAARFAFACPDRRWALMMKRTIMLVLLASLTPSFVLGQKKYQRPTVETPPVYRADPNTTPNSQTLADTKWFEVFKDAQLQELIHQALVNNYDMRAAAARIDEARANYGITRSNQFPTIVGSADLTTLGRSRDGQQTIPEPIGRTRTFGSVLLNLLTFELDIWGRLRKQTQAAKADVLASEEARLAVTTTLVSDVATAYFNLRELDSELEIAHRTLTSRQESLRIIKLRESRGVSNMLEVRQAEQLVYSATEVIPDLEKSIEQNENFISFLTGKNPHAVTRGASLTEQQMPPAVPAGLPSDLIARRPDIRSAEEQLISPNAPI